MDTKLYIETLYDRYSLYYSVERDINILNENINIFAKFKDIQGRTFLTQNDIIDAFEINEISFVKHFEKFDDVSFANFIEFLKKAASEFVEPKIDHMCTNITGVIITQDEVSEELKNAVRKFKYNESYFFILHGWCEIRLLVINPEKEEITANKRAKKVLKFYKFTNS